MLKLIRRRYSRARNGSIKQDLKLNNKGKSIKDTSSKDTSIKDTSSYYRSFMEPSNARTSIPSYALPRISFALPRTSYMSFSTSSSPSFGRGVLLDKMVKDIKYYMLRDNFEDAIDVLLIYMNALYELKGRSSSLKHPFLFTYEQLSKAYLGLKHYDKALNYANLFLELQPDSEPGHILLADIYREVHDLHAFETCALKLYDLNKSNEDYVLAASYEYYNNDHFSKSLKVAQVLIDHGCNHHALYVILSLNSYCIGDHEAGESYFNKAIEINPNADDIYREIGNLKHRLGDSMEGFVMMMKAYALNKENPYNIFYMALLADALKHHEEAKAYLDELIELHPNFIDAYILYIKILNSLKQYQEAEKYSEMYIKERPLRFDGYYFKGLVQFYKNEYSKATVSFEKAIYLEPTYYKTYLHIYETYMKQGSQEEAIKWLEKGIQVSNEKEKLKRVKESYEEEKKKEKSGKGEEKEKNKVMEEI